MKQIPFDNKNRPKHNNNILIANQKLDMPWPGMVDFDILGYSDGRPLHEDVKDLDSFIRAKDLLQLLYHNVLINDPFWHFIWEGSFVVLRISKNNKKKVEAFFKKFHLRYHFKGVYGKDGQLSTERYQKVFTYIYHGFSILAMEDTSNIYNFIPELSEHGHNWEPIIISRNAVRRAFHIGCNVTQPDPPPSYTKPAKKKVVNKRKNKK